MRLYRSALAGIALGALLPVSAAQAATGVSAAGSAVSSATLVKLSVGELLDVVDATELSLGTLTMHAQNITAAAPSVTFVPVTLNGVQKGAVTVTPANSPKTVGGVSTGDLGVLSATGPGASIKAADGAVRSASLGSTLGQATILGLAIGLDGGVAVDAVSDTSHAQAGKTLTIKNVELPNVADLLGALGIDFAKLPVATLNRLVSDLRVTISETTQTALDAANEAVDSAGDALATGQAEVAAATAELTTATEAFDAALSGATLPAELSGPLDHEDWDGLSAEAKTAVLALNTGLSDAAAAYEDAKAAVPDEADDIPALQAALDAAEGVLAGIVEGILGGLPLAKIGAAKIGTDAAVSKAAKAASVTGTISGVEVLGNDVLSDVTGESTLDVAAIVGDVADDVNAALNTATSALSDILSDLTGMVVPAPQVTLLTKKTSTGTAAGFGTADATVTALSISLGSATIPAAYALEGAGELPGVGAVTEGFKTAPLAIQVGVLGESAKFRPGTTTATPNKPAKPGSTPTHPATGGPAGLGIVAVIGAALAVGVRRRLRTTGTTE